MLSSFAKLLLVATAFAPVLLTYAFALYLERGVTAVALSLIAATMGLVLLCLFVIRAARSQLEALQFPITSVKTADMEVVGFVLAYLLPLVSTTSETVNLPVLAFVLAIFFLVVWSTNSYHFNPLLGMLCYHFYEVTTESGVTFLLITRKDVRNSRSVGRVVQLTDYMVLDSESG